MSTYIYMLLFTKYIYLKIKQNLPKTDKNVLVIIKGLYHSCNLM